MDKIEVGEYVRTKDGIIAKVTDVLKEYCIDCDNDVFDLYNGPMMEIPWEYIEEYIVKHSFNIIDLIEVGDLVFIEINGRSDWIYVYNEEMIETIIEHVKTGMKIKLILTHEQYERDCFVVEEEE